LNPRAPAFSVAARAAGSILAAVYLLGAVPGPVMAVVGALALVTFGRLLITDREEAALDAAALALLAAALLVGALRWRTLDLAEIRGAQTVLGPTLLLGPQTVAIAMGIAASAGTIALAEWEAFPRGGDVVDRFWWVSETLLGGLALVSIFWGPEIAGGSEGASLALTVGSWIGFSLAATIAALLISFGLRRLGHRARAAVLLVVLIALVVATGLIGSAA
jgi:cytosine/uracil/thiamine/allantoin permease